MRAGLKTGILILSLAWTRAGGAEPPVTAAAENGVWKQIESEQGITVWRLVKPGVEMPGFRAEVDIDAPAARIVEVLQQVEHHTEWMKNCSDARILKFFDKNHMIIYNRMDVPWPVWDRDTVLDALLTYADNQITLTVRNDDPSLIPLPDRVVRMPRVDGSYVLTKLGPNKTRVRYTLELDIGGSVPAWVANRVARETPLETLARLRERVTGHS